ncbi:EAL domain-containing protein [Pelagibacterium xiamenense]|uniref:EAL domain-containing protein n=1 Tax=Pelagibacterium xiamenense TaxID=2901140 RepID=UPI001E3545E0|nr:EAL domain-containing protein [Pelagibacterium xiamenense]MCD7060527.1 EAL domain-containing protein [Pelagibacterium xiamenense]
MRKTPARDFGGKSRAEVAEFLEIAMLRTDRAILVSDVRRRARFVNPAFTRLFGYSIDDVKNTNPWVLLAGPKTDARLHERAGRGTSSFSDDFLLHTKSGATVWVSAKIDAIYDEDGTFRYLMAMLTDTTGSTRLQHLQRSVLEAMARDMPLDALMTLLCSRVEAIAPDVTCSVLAVDQERLRLLAAPSMPAHMGEIINGVPIGPRVGACGTAAWRGEPVTTTDIETDPLWADYKAAFLPLGYKACWSSPMVLRDGRVAGTFAFYFAEKQAPSEWHREIVDTCVHLCSMAIERHEARARINRLSYYDALTGLPNRQLMRERIARSIAADPLGQHRFAFLCVDIDRFKDINDNFGHEAGDTVLSEVGERLLALAGNADMVCRLDGDTFVLALNNANADSAARAARDIIDSLLKPVSIAGQAIALSSSVGIAFYPDDGADVDTLQKSWDTAMREAKAAGRATYQFFSPAMNAMTQDRLVLGNALRAALADDRLHMAYQPQFDASGTRLYGVEALARWRDRVHGDVPPDRFVSIAEEIGVIDSLGQWALRTACGQLARWRADGFDIPMVSVNISPLQFRNPEFCCQVEACLAEFGLAPADLTLEITEGLMLDRTPRVVTNTERLTNMGVHLAMDDFGTGYSSLSLLARLPVDELKIDRGFMDRLDNDANAQAVVTAVVRIGQSLGMSVVAEGVETDAQRMFLEAAGCTVHQGYFYARPMTDTAFSEWLTTRPDWQPRKRA